MRRARGSAFLSEINPTAGPIATGRREQLTQGPDKDRNAQPATDILGPGRLGHHVVASCGPGHIPVVRIFLAPQRGGAVRSAAHTSELQSLMRISSAVFSSTKYT